ncbi:MAG: hypothetical protein DMF87_12180 [Acidobacteria bacterium]|nr:MAG: hypothetical protein DMF87_12180 [Acidobacteriota bacterium]
MLAAAIGCGAASPSLAQQPGAEALVDRHFTVGAGASISATIGTLVARGEDRAVPQRLFAEEGASRRTANVGYRIFKHIFFDAPQEHLLLVFDHEVFGHGARLRERFNGPIEYGFHLPWPYGGGGAETAYVFDREPTPYERLAVSAGGMEATGVVAAIVANHAFADGRIRSRDALRYFTFEIDTLRYIATTGKEGGDPGNDVGDFLRTYNGLADAAGAPHLTARRLRQQALAGLANPMLAYAAFGVARYWSSGAPDVAVPALSIGDVRYLPMFRYRLAPYGTEWALVNALAGRMRPTEIELRFGEAPQSTPWGIGVRQRDIVKWNRWTIDGAVDVWSQPPVGSSDAQHLALDPRIGTRVGGRINYAVTRSSGSPATLILDIGVKSGGYIPGEPLGGGLTARAGVGLPLP